MIINKNNKFIYKKSVVLLITMLFISGISILIMDNLKDSNKFISLSQNSENLVQTNVAIKNVNDEVKKLLNSMNEDDLNELIENLPPFIMYANIKVILDISIYDQSDKYIINKNYSDTLDTTLLENIDYRYDLYNIAKNKKIINNRQVNDIINEYVSITKDTKILNIKDDFTFALKDYNTSKTYISCNYDLIINDAVSHVDMIFEHKSKKNKYFDFYFKSENND
jgi:hypothetical protein